MVQRDHTDDANNDSPTRQDGPKDSPTTGAGADSTRFGRRSFLKLSGGALAAGAASVGTVGSASAFDVSSGDGYDVWTVSGKEVYDLSDGEDLSNVLVDQTADGACLTIRSRNKTDWTVRNVGFVGVGQAGDGGNRFQFQVSTPSGGHGLIENVWANGKARNGQPATELGGIYVRSSHAGHLDIRHTYIEGFGNNAVYGSAVGKDGGNDGSVAMENCYHRDNTVSQFRIGSPDSTVRNCVGVVNDPDGDRGWYPGTDGNRNARGIWGKHYPDQRIENTSFYISPDDDQPDGVFEARYISDRSHGSEAVVESVGCQLNADAPTLSGSTSNARVNFTDLGESPTVGVIQDGGVPLTPEMAASGDRSMPPTLPGETTDDTDDGTNDDSKTLDRTITFDGSDADWTDYEVTVSGEIEDNPDVGSFDPDDAIDGSTATGFVNGGVDGYVFSGEVTAIAVDGDADVLVDGQVVDPDPPDGANPVVSTGGVTDLTSTSVTLSGTLDDLDGASEVAVGFDWRAAGESSWTSVSAGSDATAGSFSATLSELSAATDYEYRATATTTDGTTSTGSTAGFRTDDNTTLDRTITFDGSDADWTDYEVTVSGEIEDNPDVGSFDPDDAIDGSTATGFVNGGVDGYVFSGKITAITVDGEADVIVDGEVVSEESIVLPNKLVFDANGSDAETTYAFEVSGDLVNDTSLGAIEDEDSLGESTVTGTVRGDDRDGFRFSGDLIGLELDGKASVIFEDVE